MTGRLVHEDNSAAWKICTAGRKHHHTRHRPNCRSNRVAQLLRKVITLHFEHFSTLRVNLNPYSPLRTYIEFANNSIGHVLTVDARWLYFTADAVAVWNVFKERTHSHQLATESHSLGCENTGTILAKTMSDTKRTLTSETTNKTHTRT